MVRAISVLAVGALLAGLLAGTAAAETFVGANGDDNSTVGTDAAAGDAMEALIGGDTVDARGGKTWWHEGPRTTGGWTDPPSSVISPATGGTSRWTGTAP
jgi:hypothetical protein